MSILEALLQVESEFTHKLTSFLLSVGSWARETTIYVPVAPEFVPEWTRETDLRETLITMGLAIDGAIAAGIPEDTLMEPAGSEAVAAMSRVCDYQTWRLGTMIRFFQIFTPDPTEGELTPEVLAETYNAASGAMVRIAHSLYKEMEADAPEPSKGNLEVAAR